MKLNTIILKSFCLLLLIGKLQAQSCGSCTINISSSSSTLSTAAFTVGSGQIFCVDSTGRFTGTLTLSGGTVCNRGYFKPSVFSFNSGQINNYGNLYIAGSHTLSSSKSILNANKSVFKVGGNLTVSGGTLTLNGIMNVKGDFIYGSGAVSNSGILNCSSFTGNLSNITNTGIINKDN